MSEYCEMRARVERLERDHSDIINRIEKLSAEWDKDTKDCQTVYRDFLARLQKQEEQHSDLKDQFKTSVKAFKGVVSDLIKRLGVLEADNVGNVLRISDLEVAIAQLTGGDYEPYPWLDADGEPLKVGDVICDVRYGAQVTVDELHTHGNIDVLLSGGNAVLLDELPSDYRKVKPAPVHTDRNGTPIEVGDLLTMRGYDSYLRITHFGHEFIHGVYPNGMVDAQLPEHCALWQKAKCP